MSAAPLLDDRAEASRLPRLLAGLRRDGAHVSLDMHTRMHGRLEPVRDLISLVEQSGLTGRGGAAFPAASKLDAVRSGRGRPIVVVNGAEGGLPVSISNSWNDYIGGLHAAVAILGRTNPVVRAARGESPRYGASPARS